MTKMIAQNMLETIGKVLLVAAIAAALVYAIQPRYSFIIRIARGSATATKGKVTAAFLSDAARACAEFQVMHGWIGGVQRRGRVALAFSPSIPPACRQRLRNLWTMHG